MGSLMDDLFDNLTVEKYDIIRRSRTFFKKLGCDIYINDGFIFEAQDGFTMQIINKKGILNFDANNLLMPSSLYLSKIYFQPCTFKSGTDTWFSFPRSDGYYPFNEALLDIHDIENDYIVPDSYKPFEYYLPGAGWSDDYLNDNIAILQKYYSKQRVKK